MDPERDLDIIDYRAGIQKGLIKDDMPYGHAKGPANGSIPF
jgi:hypothetical protein